MGVGAAPFGGRALLRGPWRGRSGPLLIVLVFVTVALVFPPACGRDEGPRPALEGKGKLYFEPLSDFPPEILQRLNAYYKAKHGLDIETVPAVPLDRSVVDEGRRQVVAEEIVALMKRSRPDLANDPEAILIGFTAYDMYIRGVPNWRWAFSWREEGRFAVISTARMDPKIFPYYPGPLALQILQAVLEKYGIPVRMEPEADVLQRRLRKMVSKTIGIMYFRLPQSQDRRSVMYGPILGLDDLDRMGEEF